MLQIADNPSIQHQEDLKIIGFRNVLVHHYLDANEAVVIAIIEQGLYQQLQTIIDVWQTKLIN